MEPNNHILALIIADLNQTADRQQQEELQHWIEASPANREEYETYARIWRESSAALRTPAFDTDAAWKRVASRQLSENQQGNSRHGRPASALFYLKRMVVAASVIILIGAGFFLWLRPTRLRTVADNENRSVALPDGSVVTLRKGSTLTYEPQYNETERSVQLEGEAFFQVKPDKTRPFLVWTPQTQVKVTGTSFLVRSGKGVEEVMVASGKVLVSDRKQENSRVQLIAGQKAVLHSNQLEQVLLTDSNYMAWKTGVLNFNNAPLTAVLEELEAYYAVPIEAEGQDSAALNKTAITVRFEHQPLQQALDELALITGLQVKRDGGRFLLYKKH